MLMLVPTTAALEYNNGVELTVYMQAFNSPVVCYQEWHLKHTVNHVWVDSTVTSWGLLTLTQALTTREQDHVMLVTIVNKVRPMVCGGLV